MKKYKYIAVCLMASVLLTTGCADSFLEVSSPTDETIDTYFTTDEHIQEAVVAAYDPLHWPDWAFDEYNPVNLMSDIMADDLWVGGDSKTDNQPWHLMMNFEAIPTNMIYGLWKCAYSGVKRCNDVITYLDWATDVTDANRAYYEAQVIALRVFYYNWVWKFWGNVPYFDKNLTAPYVAEQLTADQLYEKMVTSLEEVIQLNVLPMREDSENYGRVTLAMVYMLYAEIVMYQNDDSRYSTALKYMEEIISSPQYDLMPDYTDIFKETGEWSIESIFEINYKTIMPYATGEVPSLPEELPCRHSSVRISGLMEQTITTVAGDSARYVKKPTSAIPITTPAATPLAGMHKPCLTLTMRNTQAINCHTPHAIRTPASSLKNMLPSPATTKTRSQVRS